MAQPGGEAGSPLRPFGLLQETFGDAPMVGVFSERATIRAWLDVERALAISQASLGVIPDDAATAIVARIDDLELAPGALTEGTRHVGYPIVALLAAISEGASPDVGAFLHWGATTQDIMDTGLVLQVKAALDRLETLEIALGDHVAALADAYRTTVMAARTHGQQAVPTTFGAKVAVWLDELARHRQRLADSRGRALLVALFGAGGTAAAMGPKSAAVRRGVAEAAGIAAGRCAVACRP